MKSTTLLIAPLLISVSTASILGGLFQRRDVHARQLEPAKAPSYSVLKRIVVPVRVDGNQGGNGRAIGRGGRGQNGRGSRRGRKGNNNGGGGNNEETTATDAEEATATDAEEATATDAEEATATGAEGATATDAEFASTIALNVSTTAEADAATTTEGFAVISTGEVPAPDAEEPSETQEADVAESSAEAPGVVETSGQVVVEEVVKTVEGHPVVEQVVQTRTADEHVLVEDILATTTMDHIVTEIVPTEIVRDRKTIRSSYRAVNTRPAVFVVVVQVITVVEVVVINIGEPPRRRRVQRTVTALRPGSEYNSLVREVRKHKTRPAVGAYNIPPKEAGHASVIEHTVTITKQEKVRETVTKTETKVETKIETKVENKVETKVETETITVASCSTDEAAAETTATEIDTATETAAAETTDSVTESATETAEATETASSTTTTEEVAQETGNNNDMQHGEQNVEHPAPTENVHEPTTLMTVVRGAQYTPAGGYYLL
ncbi:hypothetical protein Dda_1960 [Drechslerella dactyloides]|uniref:Uncharacterized protein n=1 Tax=Drechslerella dactyloides TaxID=74499 RepID=A0AAD6J6W6_DREDA|nr:hypothetical protein Dda_1960 [Drechslerella dactyloides]